MSKILTEAAYLNRFFRVLLLLAVAACLLVLPYTMWWLYKSGDVAVERAVADQAAGRFVIFGSGVSQDFVDYKLQLYAKVKPEIAAVGSSRVMQFRSAYFRKTFLNVGGTAGNLSVLRSTLTPCWPNTGPRPLSSGWISGGSCPSGIPILSRTSLPPAAPTTTGLKV